MTPCICGCGRPAAELHHVVTQAELRKVARGLRVDPKILTGDPRGMVPLCLQAHHRHHNRQAPLLLSVLPDEAFEFASYVLGIAPAWVYLRRFYEGEDPRLDALVDDLVSTWEEAA